VSPCYKVELGYKLTIPMGPLIKIGYTKTILEKNRNESYGAKEQKDSQVSWYCNREYNYSLCDKSSQHAERIFN
jgi:hypothetical protein